MRTLNVAAIAALVLVATPALAQSQGDSKTTTTSTTNTTQNSDGSTTTTTTTRSRSSSSAVNVDPNALAATIGSLFGVRPPRVTTAEAAGAWQVLEYWNNREHVCSLELKLEKKWGMLQASRTGCFGTMFSVGMWQVQDGAVALIRPGGQIISKVRGDATRLSGQAADGTPIVLYREN